MFIFYPVGGLANRMRVIDSAVNLCKMLDKSYRVYWFKDAGLNCAFSTIWQPQEFIIDTKSKFLHLLFKFKRKYNLFRKFLKLLEKLQILKVYSETEYNDLFAMMKTPSALNKYWFCIISTFSAFYSSDDFPVEIFKLQPEIEKLVCNESSDFNQHSIGVHIRRTDNVDSIQQSPLELFVNRMSEEIASEPKTNFYIASDSEEVKTELKRKFADNVKFPKGELSRNTEHGIIQAVVELYTLSRTNKVFGSFYSSFSQAAAELGGVEYEVITQNSSANV